MSEKDGGTNGPAGFLDQLKESVRQAVLRGIAPLQKQLDRTDGRVADLERRVQELERRGDGR